MPQLVKKRRSGWAVLAAGALIASLFAVGAAPAGAVEIKAGSNNEAQPSRPATYSSCVGDAASDAMFEDVSEGHAFEGAINCIAYYGITIGTGDGSTFSPGDDVSRWQMALFLARAAGVAGAALDAASDQGFADIGDAPDEAQDAINQLAAAGIMLGATTTAYNPNDDVTRADMAGFLVRLLAHVDSSVVQVSSDSEVTYGSRKINLAAAGDLDYFADARRLARGVDNLISAAYELGITKGTGDGTTFSPRGTVTRGQMAAFITRTLAHTGVRPAGVSAQADGSTVTVSVRDDDFAPVVNAQVDLFSVPTSRADDAFNDDGTCSRLVDGHPASAGTCQISRGDNLTGPDGDTEYTVAVGKGLTVWAWTGASNAKFSDSTNAYRLAVTPAGLPATRANVTSDLPEGAAKARFGSTVTFTVQLENTSGAEPVNVGPGNDPFSYYLTRIVSRLGRTIQQTLPSTVTIGSDGSATFALTWPDPDGGADNPDFVVKYVLIPKEVPATASAINNPRDSVVFSDDSGAAAHAVSASTDGYEYADTRGATTYVTASVINVYGEPLSRVAVELGCDSASDPRTYHTGGNGSVRIPHDYSGGPGKQTLCARTANALVASAASAFYWLTDDDEADTNGVIRTGSVVHGDVDSDEIVVLLDGVPVLVVYDDDDRYSTDNATGAAQTVTMESFSDAAAAAIKAASEGERLSVLTWRFYDHRDSSEITEWALTIEPTVAGIPRVVDASLQPAGTGEQTQITLTFSEALDVRTRYVPDESQFSVEATRAGDSRDMTVDSVTILQGGGDNKVLLGLADEAAPADALTAADTVTASYSHTAADEDATAQLLRADESPDLNVLAFSDESVRNDIPPVLVPSEPSAAAPDGNPTVDGTVLTMRFDAALDSTSRPTTDDFTVTVGYIGRAVTGATVSGNEVTLTLASSVSFGDVVHVSYDGTALRADASRYAVVEEIVEEPVNVLATNLTPPVHLMATVLGSTDDATSSLVLTFDALLLETAPYVPHTSQFTVSGVSATAADGSPAAVSAVEIDDENTDDDSEVTLTLNAAVTAADTSVTVSYSHNARDQFGRISPVNTHLLRADTADPRGAQTVDAFTRAVRNDTPPVLLDQPAGVTVNGRTLTLTFNAPLDPGSVPAGSVFSGVSVATDDQATLHVNEGLVRVSGATVSIPLETAATAGDDVSVTYSPPGADEQPLRAAASPNAAVAEISSTMATNLTPASATAAATVEDLTTVTLTFNVAMSLTDGSSSASNATSSNTLITSLFTVTDTSIGADVASVTVNGLTVTLTLAAALEAEAGNMDVLVSYAGNSDWWLQSATGVQPVVSTAVVISN